MIESSFCWLSGVGPVTEQRWWTDGISAWSAFLSRSAVPGISRPRKVLYDEDVALAMEQYERHNARFFSRCLAPRHQWRLYQWLRPVTVYLDIETDAHGDITVVGLFGRHAMTSLVRGESLTEERLCAELERYDLLVSFCGSTFDLPMLRAQFPRLVLNQPHVDLYRVARALGLRGGLKAIEAANGITRRQDLQGMDGFDAVRWWNRWRYEHDPIALERLLAYNEADCVNLQPLADRLYCDMAQHIAKWLPSS